MSNQYTYLETYVDSLKGLPNDLTRGFLLIRQLDKRAGDQHNELERHSDACIKKFNNLEKKAEPSATSEDNAAAALRDVRSRQRELVALHSEKLALVQQAQTILQSYMDRLDDEITKFRNELPEDLPFEKNGDIALNKDGKVHNPGRRGAAADEDGGDDGDDMDDAPPPAVVSAPPAAAAPIMKRKKTIAAPGTGAAAGAAAAAAAPSKLQSAASVGSKGAGAGAGGAGGNKLTIANANTRPATARQSSGGSNPAYGGTAASMMMESSS